MRLPCSKRRQERQGKLEDLTTDQVVRRLDRQWAVVFAVLLLGGGGMTLQQWRTNDLATRTTHIANKNRALVAQIQRERKRNTLASCRKGNAQNAALRGFIRASIPKNRLKSPLVRQYLKRADQTFPAVNCKADVRQKVRPPA